MQGISTGGGQQVWGQWFRRGKLLKTEVKKGHFYISEVTKEGIGVFANKNHHPVLDYAHLDELWKRRGFVKTEINKPWPKALTKVINELWRQSDLKKDTTNESYYWAVVCDRAKREEANADEVESFRLQEQAAGFESDSTIRKIVEPYAMDRAKKELSSRGFSNFEDTSEHRCYDYTCERQGTLYYVEVKGTQGSGASVILTKNEVAHAKKHQPDSIAVIVHDIEVDSEKGEARGGTVCVCFPWTLEPAALRALQYQWTVSGCTEALET